MNKNQSYSNIVVQLRGGSEYLETIELTDTEEQLLLANTNNAWDLMCESIQARLGIEIIGNYNLISYTVNGITKPLH